MPRRTLPTAPSGSAAPLAYRRGARVVPPALFAAAVLAMAGPWASSEATGAVTSSFFTSLGWSPALAAAANVGLRKGGHVLAYAVFGVLVTRAVREGARPVRRALVALGFAVALATADEALQGLSPTRGGSGFDVLLDAGGAGLGIAFLTRRERSARARAAARAVGTPEADRPTA